MEISHTFITEKKKETETRKQLDFYNFVCTYGRHFCFFRKVKNKKIIVQ